MATPTTAEAAAPQGPAVQADLTDLIRVAVPDRGLRQDLRAASIVWRRELIRFRTDRLRMITSLVQPVLFLFVLGTGRARRAQPPPGRQLQDLHLPGHRRHGRAVHRDLLGRLDRLGP
jgi:hypothetical protein